MAIMGAEPLRNASSSTRRTCRYSLCSSADLAHVGAQGAGNAVAEQDAEEGADEGGGDFFADLLGRAAERAHGDDDAEHGGDDAQPGERVGDGGEGVDGLHFGVVVHFHVELHHLVHVEGLDAAGDGGAQGVADKVAGVMVIEELGVVFEDGAFLGLFDVHFDAEQAFFADLVEELVHHFEGAEVAFLVELGTFEDGQKAGDDALDDVDRVGHEQGAGGGANEDEQLGRLHEDEYVSLLHEEAADDCSEDNENAYDGEHECPSGAGVI